MGMPTCLSSQKKATLPSLPYNRGFKSDCVCEALHACPLSTQGLRLDQILLTPSPDSTFYFRWQRLKPWFFTHRLLPLSHTHRILAEPGWGNRTGKVCGSLNASSPVTGTAWLGLDGALREGCAGCQLWRFKAMCHIPLLHAEVQDVNPQLLSQMPCSPASDLSPGT